VARFLPLIFVQEFYYSILYFIFLVKNQEVNCLKFFKPIVSAVEICKQCLQTASAVGGVRRSFWVVPNTPYRGFAPGLYRGLLYTRTPWAVDPK